MIGVKSSINRILKLLPTGLEKLLLRLYRGLRRRVMGILLDHTKSVQRLDAPSMPEMFAGGSLGKLSLIYVYRDESKDFIINFLNSLNEHFELVLVLPPSTTFISNNELADSKRFTIVEGLKNQAKTSYFSWGFKAAIGEYVACLKSLEASDIPILDEHWRILLNNPQFDVVHGNKALVCRRWVGLVYPDILGLGSEHYVAKSLPFKAFPASLKEGSEQPFSYITNNARTSKIAVYSDDSYIRSALVSEASKLNHTVVSLDANQNFQEVFPKALIVVDKLDSDKSLSSLIGDRDVRVNLILTHEIDESSLKSYMLQKCDLVFTNVTSNYYILKNASLNVIYTQDLERATPLIIWASAKNNKVSAQGAPGIRVSKRINLLIETASLNRGGLEQVIYDLANNIDRDRFNVFIACTKSKGEIAEKCEKNGIPVLLTTDTVAYSSLLESYKIDVVNSHYSELGLRAISATKIPLIDVVHNNYVWFSPAECSSYAQKNQRAFKFVGVSYNVARYSRHYLGISAEKMSVIPNGFDLQRFGNELHVGEARLNRRDLGVADTDYLFLNVASLSYLKAHNVMMAALEELGSAPSLKVLCVAHSVDNVYAEYFHEQLEKRKLQDRLLYLESVSPDIMQDLYLLSDAFLLPSLVEGWSISVMEAMYFGLPLLLTNVGGAEHVIHDSDVGIIIPTSYGEPTNLNFSNLSKYGTEQKPANTIDLVHAMLDFYNNQDSWRARGRLGQEKLNEFSIKNTVRSYERLFIEAYRSYA